MSKISIVTVTYNAEKNLSFFLPSIVKNLDISPDIYFIDNASKDNTLILLNQFKKERTQINIEIISNKQNYGYAKAINIGIKKALENNSKYIFVTNNDIIFDPGFFSQMLKDAEDNTLDIVGVPASINNTDLGLGYNLDTKNFYPKKDKPLKRQDLEKAIKFNPLPKIDFPHGGTILFSKLFFEKIGLYDEDLFFGGDEKDFLYRVNKYNSKNENKIKGAVSLKSFSRIDNLSKHNNGHKIIKARGMLQGDARVNLKHKFTPTQIGLYKAQNNLIKELAKGRLIRYIILYYFSLRGLIIESYKYYIKNKSNRTY